MRLITNPSNKPKMTSCQASMLGTPTPHPSLMRGKSIWNCNRYCKSSTSKRTSKSTSKKRLKRLKSILVNSRKGSSKRSSMSPVLKRCSFMWCKQTNLSKMQVSVMLNSKSSSKMPERALALWSKRKKRKSNHPRRSYLTLRLKPTRIQTSSCKTQRTLRASRVIRMTIETQRLVTTVDSSCWIVNSLVDWGVLERKYWRALVNRYWVGSSTWPRSVSPSSACAPYPC